LIEDKEIIASKTGKLLNGCTGGGGVKRDNSLQYKEIPQLFIIFLISKICFSEKTLSCFKNFVKKNFKNLKIFIDFLFFT
jgi:hypothetical protein